MNIQMNKKIILYEGKYELSSSQIRENILKNNFELIEPEIQKIIIEHKNSFY